MKVDSQALLDCYDGCHVREGTLNQTAAHVWVLMGDMAHVKATMVLADESGICFCFVWG